MLSMAFKVWYEIIVIFCIGTIMVKLKLVELRERDIRKLLLGLILNMLEIERRRGREPPPFPPKIVTTDVLNSEGEVSNCLIRSSWDCSETNIESIWIFWFFNNQNNMLKFSIHVTKIFFIKTHLFGFLHHLHKVN